MEFELMSATLSLTIALYHIAKGDVHHNHPEWSWELEVVALEHDILVMEYGVSRNIHDFNQALDALMKESANG